MKNVGRLLTLAVCVTFSTASAQEVTRSVSNVNWDRTTITVDAAANQVRISSSDGIRYVSISASRENAKSFADSAERLVARSATVSNSPDTIRFEVELKSDIKGDDVSLIREVTAGSSMLELFFHDKNVIRTLHVSVSPAQATAFIGSIRRAAQDAAELGPRPSGGDTAQSSAMVYLAFQVEKPVSQIPGYGAPRYPDKLRASRIEGEVQAQFVVDERGIADVSTLKVLMATNSDFAQAVRNALPLMRFHAAETGGHKVKQLVKESFGFTLSR